MGFLLECAERIFKTQFMDKMWNRRVEGFDRFNAVNKQGGIVLLGDSITEFFQINEIYKDEGIVNRGISGDTTAGVLSRMKESVYDLQPRRIFILIGTNDIDKPKYSENLTAGNIKTIIGGIQSKCPNTKIFLECVYPINGEMKNSDAGRCTNALIDSLNDRIVNIAKELGIEYIDISPQLKDNAGNLKEEYTYDGLHLNGFGYKAVLALLLPYFK